MESQTVVRVVLILLAAIILVGLVVYYNKNKSRLEAERFYFDSKAGDLSEGMRAAKKKKRQQEEMESFEGDDGEGEEYVDEEGFRDGNGQEDDEDGEDGEDGGQTREAFKDGSGKSKKSSGYDVAPSDPTDENMRPVDFGSDGVNTVKSCYPSDSIKDVSQLLPKDAANSKWAQVNPAGQGDVKDQNFMTAGYHVGINTVGQSMRNPNLSIRSEPPNPRINVSPWMQSTIEPDLSRRPLEIGGC